MQHKEKRDLLAILSRLFERLPQTGGESNGSHINVTIVESGAQYVQHIDTQIFGDSKPLETVELPSPQEVPPPVTSAEERIRNSIARLMEEEYNNEKLFNLQSHWQAVYRILVDKGFCKDSNFDAFDAFIRNVMPEHVNKPYTKASVKQISQTDFSRPFKDWSFDTQTSKTRKPYDRMRTIALRFIEILEKNSL
ncbi:hypothetical protein SAMN05216354_0462 [Xylanibacter ruminicola]|uniref:Uncharacterized protein n=1 Tax=Xylanibacter ruminicola TaxID=839 RepID=A0A1H5S1G1_XYLRU|nr:hypothetical protein SAMN05216354_0462 [Xylanibacter ruminicola]